MERTMARLNFYLLALVALGWSLSSAAAFPQTRQNRGSVIVVGGGVAGLTAAANLDRAGFNVTLFEAMGRVGGRTYTLKMPDGQYMEMGGEWIHGEKNNSIFELVYPLGIVDNSTSAAKKPMQLYEYGTEFGLSNGEYLNSSLADKLEELLDFIWFDPNSWGEDVEDEMNMGEWARYVLDRYQEEFFLHDDPLFLEAVYDWAHRTSLAEDAADNWYQISASDEGEQYIWLEGQANVRWIPPYSYSSLHQLILTGNVTEDGLYDIPSWIFRNTEVTRIEYSPGGAEMVTVFTRDGRNHTADHVVFTPSLGVLKAQHETLFVPQLSAKKQLAIENIGFGSVAKICLEFSEPWWPVEFEGLFPIWTDHDYTNRSLEYWREDITKEELMVEIDGIPLWCRAILSFHNVDSGSAPNVFRVWLSGVPSKVLDEFLPDYVRASVMKALHKFLDPLFPNITEPIRSYQTVWWSNSYTRGAYSFRRPESDEQDVWASDLAEPIHHIVSLKPLLCFAGEATHSNYYATVHGAYETGLREYRRILAYYET